MALITPILTTFLFFTTIALYIFWCWNRRKLYAISSKIPGPFSLPIIGSIGFVKEALQDHSKTFIKYLNMHSGIFHYWLGTELFIAVSKPNDIENVFSSDIVSKSPKLADDWINCMGHGIVAMSATEDFYKWKSHNRLVSLSLSTQAMKNYFKIIQKKCISLVEDTGKFSGIGIVDIDLLVFRHVADVTTETLFAKDFEFRKGKRDNAYNASESIGQNLSKKIKSVWYEFKLLYAISDLKKSQDRSYKILKDLSKEIFCSKKDELQFKHIDELNDSVTIEALLKGNKLGQISENEIIDEITNIWTAATDTTSTVLKLFILTMAMNKKCQDKAFEQIRSIIGDEKKLNIEYDDLEKFTYVDMCMKETLRLFSPGPVTLRYVTKEWKFKNRDMVIPPNTTFAICNFATHRDPDIWHDPEDFIPERFHPDKMKKMHSYSFLPFSGGPRQCLGRALAKTLLRLTMVHLLSNFELHSDWNMKEVPLVHDVNVNFKWGYKVSITKRDW